MGSKQKNLDFTKSVIGLWNGMLCEVLEAATSVRFKWEWSR